MTLEDNLTRCCQSKKRCWKVLQSKPVVRVRFSMSSQRNGSVPTRKSLTWNCWLTGAGNGTSEKTVCNTSDTSICGTSETSVCGIIVTSSCGIGVTSIGGANETSVCGSGDTSACRASEVTASVASETTASGASEMRSGDQRCARKRAVAMVLW